MPTYKLTYFGIYGRAEIIRLLFAYAKVDFEDVRIREISPELKQKLTYGQLPLFEVNTDGKTIQMSQSMAICRYLANKFQLMGSNDVEAFRVDELIEGLTDYSNSWLKIRTAPDEDSKAKLTKEAIEVATPKYFAIFTKALEQNGGRFLVGNQVTWADLTLYNFIIYFGILGNVDLTKGCPRLQEFVKNIGNISQIREYMEKRPKLTF